MNKWITKFILCINSFKAFFLEEAAIPPPPLSGLHRFDHDKIADQKHRQSSMADDDIPSPFFEERCTDFLPRLPLFLTDSVHFLCGIFSQRRGCAIAINRRKQYVACFASLDALTISFSTSPRQKHYLQRPPQPPLD